MKKLISFILPLLFLCGCSMSVEELLSPPKLDEEQSAIYDALRLSKGGDVNLKYPVSGQYRSAFVVQDIDDEPTNEAIVFYEASNVTDEGSSLRLNFLDRQDGNWVSVYDFAAMGSEVEKVQFADLGNSKTSIIITYSLQNSSDKGTSVFSYENNMPSEVYKSRHVYMNLIDINEDGAEEMFMINSDSADNTAAVNLLGWEENGFSLLSSVPLSADFTACRNIQLGNATATGRKGIFIDYTLTDGAVGTDVMLCYDRSLTAAQIPAAQVKRRPNTYLPFISCRDIDGDGIIEVPSAAPAPGYEDRPAGEQVSLTTWFEISSSGANLHHETTSYVSIRNDYIFNIPLRWAGVVTMNISIADGTATFSRYDKGANAAGEELLIIRAVPEASVSKLNLTGFTPCGKNESTGYCFFMQSSGNGSLALTEGEFENLFRILE